MIIQKVSIIRYAMIITKYAIYIPCSFLNTSPIP